MLRALKALWGSRKGFRWSLYFIERDQLRYALHENAVAVLLGYVIAQVEKGRRIASDWRLVINFNHNHRSIEIHESNFVRPAGLAADDTELTLSEDLKAGFRKSTPVGWLMAASQSSWTPRPRSTFL